MSSCSFSTARCFFVKHQGTGGILKFTSHALRFATPTEAFTSWMWGTADSLVLLVTMDSPLKNEGMPPLKKDHFNKKGYDHLPNHHFSGDMIVFGGIILLGPFYPSWWLNQPVWKILGQIGSFRLGVKNIKMLDTTTRTQNPIWLEHPTQRRNDPNRTSSANSLAFWYADELAAPAASVRQKKAESPCHSYANVKTLQTYNTHWIYCHLFT